MIPTGQFSPRKLPPKKIPPLRITPTWTIPTWTIPTQKISTQDNSHLHNSQPGQFLPGKFLPRKISIQLISTLDNCSPPNLTKFNNIQAIPQNFLLANFFLLTLFVMRDLKRIIQHMQSRDGTGVEFLLIVTKNCFSQSQWEIFTSNFS